ncbi:MAG: hypothetical protein ACFE0R_03390 [Salinarimonas sp.]
MPLARALVVIATIFWFSPVHQDGADALAPRAPPEMPTASAARDAREVRDAPVLDRRSLAALIAGAEADTAQAQALWRSLPEEARSALARRIADELSASARD